MYEKDKDSPGYFYSGVSARSLTPRFGLPFPEDWSLNSQVVSNQETISVQLT